MKGFPVNDVIEVGTVELLSLLSSDDVSFDLKDPYQTLDVMQLWMT